MKYALLLFFICSLFLVFPHPIIAQSPKIVSISMSYWGYSPQNIEIPQGTKLFFINTTTIDRWPASNIHPTHQIYPEFDPQRPIKPGTNWGFIFSKAGTWKYHDHLQPTISGTITVTPVANYPSPTPVPSPSPVWTNKVSDSLLSLYYKIFPNALAAKLATLNFHELIKSPDRLRFWLKLIGSDKAMQNLVSKSGGGSTFDCHQDAHQIGRAAYDLFGAPVFKLPHYECHSGFIHGAMESFIKEKGTQDLSRNIVELCMQFPTQFSQFECLHGIGHGVMAYANYDLPEAIKLCQSLGSEYSKSSCYGGVFMENIMVSLGQGATPGHTTAWLSSDPQFPCNAVSLNSSIQHECYMMQTSRMLTLFNDDFDKISIECQKVPPMSKSTCFQSMGRDIAGQTLRNPDQILKFCDKSPGPYFRDCLQGALYVVIEFWGDGLTNQASILCSKVPASDKQFCYQRLSTRLPGIYTDSAKRKTICDTFEVDYRSLCN